MLGRIRDADRINWQRAAVRVLADVLGEAVGVGLPCVHWSVGSGQTLIARCLSGDDAQRRAAFLAWAQFFALSDRHEWDSGGVIHLQASRPDFRGCNVIVTADLYQDDPEAGGRS